MPMWSTEDMAQSSVDDSNTRRLSRIEVTDIATERVTEFAATRADDAEIRFERRGGWTYLVSDE
jgi:hypothetical protein